MLNGIHIGVMLGTVALLVAVSIVSGRKVRDAKGFAVGGKAGSWMVCGALLGTLVGGQSTIGTAQMAFAYGWSAWWFTIGAALGALVLGLVYAGPLRHTGCSTLLEVVGQRYGRRAETVGSVLFLCGIFISITSQLLSSAALLGSLLRLPAAVATVVGAVLIGAMVLGGGIKSAGAGGIVKLVLLYVGSMAAGVAVLQQGGGLDGLMQHIDQLAAAPSVQATGGLCSPEEVHRRFGSLMARGPMKDLGGCLSLMLGVVCTQSYAQAVWSAASTDKARRGAIRCALLIPLIGAACTLVGLYMRGHYITAAEQAAMVQAGVPLPEGVGILRHSLEAFPVFAIEHLPSWLGGLALGALIVNVLGCGSGLVLGASTIVTRDIVGNLPHRRRGEGRLDELTLTRLAIVVLLVAGTLAARMMHGSFINDLGFLSLGLRAAALLLPLSLALWYKPTIAQPTIVASMVGGTVAMLAAGLWQWSGDPMYYGLAASAGVLAVGEIARRWRRQ